MTQFWVVFLGLRVPDLMRVLQTEPVYLDLISPVDFIKLFCPPSFSNFFLRVSCFLINALSLSTLHILLSTHFDMSLHYTHKTSWNSTATALFVWKSCSLIGLFWNFFYTCSFTFWLKFCKVLLNSYRHTVGCQLILVCLYWSTYRSHTHCNAENIIQEVRPMCE
jgi:hypothetical protein